MAHEATPRLREFSDQGLSNLIWAFAVMDARHAEFNAETARYIREECGTFDGKHLSQVHRWQRWREYHPKP